MNETKHHYDVVIVGLGKTGLSCVRYLLDKGLDIAVTDSRMEPPGLLTLKSEHTSVPAFLGEISAEIISQLQRAHRSNFFHFDLKWRNILVVRDADGHYRCSWIDCPRGRYMRLRPGRGQLVDLSSLARLSLSYLSRTRRLRRSLRKAGTDLPAPVIDEVIALAKESSLLERRIAQVDSMNEMFHYWHIFHKPFAVVMYVIMVLHVGVAVAFGYRWIF